MTPSQPMRHLFQSLALLMSVCVGTSAAAQVPADTYPTHAITLVVPFAAGGTTDIISRILAESLGKRLGQPVIVENRGGAGGNLGAGQVAGAKPDGYTLLMGYNGTNAINPSLYKQLAWDPVRSFEPVSLVARVNNVVVVNPNVPVRTLGELVSYARANPGKLNYGSAGAGSIFHLAAVMLEQQSGTVMTHVPYKGAAPAVTDLLGGQIELMFASIPTVLQHVRTGKLRAIGVTGSTRSDLFPNVPTARESGLPGLVVDSWYGVFAPRGLSPDVRQRLGNALKDALADPALKRKFEEQGAVSQGYSPTDLQDLLAKDLVTWRGVLQKSKVVIE
ncbi:MAG: LacI family transcriptional regulator [Burkholderiales bacterium PBB6]|nr:MAG: LacI family transcriptional regulator [Burkholderiales bacterium PBB6]